MTTETLAHAIYDKYCSAVGGKAFNGDPLPTSSEFFADENKQLQANAWREAAELASDLILQGKTPEPNPNHYEYVKITFDCGQLSWRYKLFGNKVEGYDEHDEGPDIVIDWSDDDILNHVRSFLCVEEDDPVKLELTVI